MDMSNLIEFVALYCAGTFFGAAAYISIAQHPASLEAGGDVAGRFFPPMYHRAAPMQITLALVGTLGGLAAWMQSNSLIWAIGSVALFSVIPITLIVIKPINDILLSPENDPSSPETVELLGQWGKRHWLRSIVSGVAFVLFVAGANV